ncbi:hypothetical protein, partial [Deinococcus sp.]|uniref:hypothetical protein n=1 Tax=Deinococcus sp. TaxID=47478 RepID=UPI002869A5DB
AGRGTDARDQLEVVITAQVRISVTGGVLRWTIPGAPSLMQTNIVINSAFVQVEASEEGRPTLPFSQIIDEIHSLRSVKCKQHF